jgi:type III secretion protein C
MRLTGPTRQMKLSSGDSINVPRIEIPLAGAQGDSGYGAQAPAPASSGTPADLPRIEADAGINAVLIRDVPEHMAQYERLIASLDTKPRLVEINLTIIDISTDSLDSLGVDWRLHTKHGDFQYGNGNNPPLTFNLGTTEEGQTGATTPVGLALTASIGGSLRNYLLARINALTQTGNAQLQAKPKVLALDNTEAILENLIHFYVPVSGFQDASLYGITTGTSVKVTPLIVNEAGQMSVMMSIDIDDGNLTNDRVSQLPVVQERSIVTKAMIEEGKSLLIAGFNSDSVNNTKSGIPFLSDVPFIGNLFKYTNKTGQHMERFYLLTPRILTAASTNPNDVPAVSIPGVGMPGPGATDWKPGPSPIAPAPAVPGTLPTPPVSRLHEPDSRSTLAAR